MDLGGYSSAIRAELKRFNCRMFAEPQVLALGKDGIAELLAAAEQARLSAHYTPRARRYPVMFSSLPRSEGSNGGSQSSYARL
jgi:hypothetical protein